ncbi:MAG: thiamine phosphate synthase [Bacteroidota bacterium]
MHKQIAHFHYLTQDIPGVGHETLAELACKGGVEWVQLRVKEQGYEDWLDTAWEVKKICNRFGAKLIINDNIEIAREVGADGVHLGKNDFPPAMARMALGPSKIIGGTANTFEDIQMLHLADVDYIGLGPFRFTETKKNLSPQLGIDGYRTLAERCKTADLNLPLIAIGGIKTKDINGLLEAGVHGVAISSGINKSDAPSKQAANFINQIQHYYSALNT